MNAVEQESEKLYEWRITDMYVQCMYPMRPDAIAASDCCRAPADTAVVRPDGMSTWRCPGHRGLIKDEGIGPVVESVMRNVAPPTRR